jgi:hypothetical protein
MDLKDREPLQCGGGIMHSVGSCFIIFHGEPGLGREGFTDKKKKEI